MKLAEIAFIIAMWKISLTASLHQVPQVAIRNSSFIALTVEIVQHVSHALRTGFFYAAYCIDESTIHYICSNRYMQGAKEQASEAMNCRAGRNESLG